MITQSQRRNPETLENPQHFTPFMLSSRVPIQRTKKEEAELKNSVYPNPPKQWNSDQTITFSEFILSFLIIHSLSFPETSFRSEAIATLSLLFLLPPIGHHCVGSASGDFRCSSIPASFVVDTPEASASG
jgi:hypothetical protein